VKRTCARCGAPFAPSNPRDTYCERHRLRGRAHRSPTTQAQDAEYRRAREEILAGDPPCHWCDRPHADTVDHVIPVARGGMHARSNLVPACSTCNLSRRDNPTWTPSK
jgi:5-methylcytosine-specific restriction endonuclease McrA